ncbi:hypothetical protein JG687_00003804 [Phytophthora cactorum]|uniref:Uncharacterized protein n=1 Tax=Phytophthora cactorum TaxID=29920 RepID=A0A8T1URM9_9STRA|nr:hypothetical protein JG687_00003804 [Phytophthora cactorum]
MALQTRTGRNWNVPKRPTQLFWKPKRMLVINPRGRKRDRRSWKKSDATLQRFRRKSVRFVYVQQASTGTSLTLAGVVVETATSCRLNIILIVCCLLSSPKVAVGSEIYLALSCDLEITIR